MAETPEDKAKVERVNQRAQKLRDYKDAQGMNRGDTLTQKQRDEALHGQITGNVPTKPVEDPNKIRAQRSKPIMEQIQTQANAAGALPIGEAIQRQLRADGVTGVGVETVPNAGAQAPVVPHNQQQQGIGGTQPAAGQSVVGEALPLPPAENIDAITTPPPGPTIAEAERRGLAPLEVTPAVEAASAAQQAGPAMRTAMAANQRDTLWEEPPPVRPALPYEEPSKKQAGLALLGALLPGVGGFLMEPFAKAQRGYNLKLEKDTKLADMFWKEFEDDPVNAKRFARVPVVRDALQRKYGMSADEIIELDKSIGQSSQLKAKDVFDLAEKGLLELPQTMETPLGQVRTLPKTQTIGGLPYELNPQTNKYELMQTETVKMYDDAAKGYLDQGYSQGEANLMAMKAVKGQPIFNATEVGNGVVLMRNDALGTVRKFSFPEAQKDKIKAELVKNELTKEPIGMFFYRQDDIPTTADDVMFMPFSSMSDKEGRNIGELIRGQWGKDKQDTGGLMSWLASKIGFGVTDHNDVIEQQGAGTPAPQPVATPVAPGSGGTAPRPIETPPAINPDESKKVGQLLQDVM